MTGWKLLLGRLGFSLAFGAMGLYLLRVAGLMFAAKRELRQRGVVVEGEIVGFEETSPSGDPAYRKVWAPIVKFRTAEGMPVQFTSAVSQRPNPYTKGQRLAVRYLPENPPGADLDSVSRSWATFLIVVFMMLVSLAVASLPWILPPPTPH
jgi:hypothetical protein